MTILAAALVAVNVLPSDTLDVFRVDTLAPGVWAARVIPRPDAYAFSNSLIVVGRQAVLIVDAQASPTASSVLVEMVRDLTDRPVRWVVNTHWHGDHVHGNQVWADAFPGVRFVGHEATRAAVLTEGAELLRSEIDELPASIEQRRQWLERDAGPDGAPLTAENRASVEYSLRLRTAYLDDLRRLRHLAPDTTFADVLRLDLGGRLVEVRHPGPAHTAGDVWVHLPDQGILAAGDLLEEGAPWIDGAWLPGWADALASMRELEPRIVLPAHGAVQRDPTLLDGQAALLAAVVESARRAVAEGWSVDEAASLSDLEAHREFLAPVGVGEAAFDAWWAGALALAMEQVSAQYR